MKMFSDSLPFYKANFHCHTTESDGRLDPVDVEGFYESASYDMKEEGTNGFGYDPIFIPEDGNGKTTASQPLSFKETHSHRAKAVGQLISWLQSRGSF